MNVLEENEVVLTAKDRCDSCSAAAQVRVSMNGLPLDFCGHHYNKNESGLEKAGAVVVVNNLVKDGQELVNA